MNFKENNDKKFKLEDYHLQDYNCERCGNNINFYSGSTCDKCKKFICDDCSIVVCNNREIYPAEFFNYDFLCLTCLDKIKDNINEK